MPPKNPKNENSSVDLKAEIRRLEREAVKIEGKLEYLEEVEIESVCQMLPMICARAPLALSRVSWPLLRLLPSANFAEARRS